MPSFRKRSRKVFIGNRPLNAMARAFLPFLLSFIFSKKLVLSENVADRPVGEAPTQKPGDRSGRVF